MIKYSKSIYKKVLKGKYYKNYRRRKIIEKTTKNPNSAETTVRYILKPTTSGIIPTFCLSIIPVNSAPIWKMKYKCGYIDMEFIEEIVKNGERSEFKAKPFWSLNGKLEKDELSRQIEVFKKMGFGGAFLHSRTGLKTEYMGEEWLDDLEFCVEELEKRGM